MTTECGRYLYTYMVTCCLSDKNINSFSHDDVIKWKHFPCYWPFVRGIHRSPVNSPQKGQWCRASMYSLICVWINGWVNNHEAGNLRRYHAHYDVIVMIFWPHMVSDILVNINSGNERIYLLSSIKSYIKHLNLVWNSKVSLYTDACSMFFAVCCCLSITTEDTFKQMH